MTLVTRIVLLLAVQTVALAAMVGAKQYTLSTGTEVLLKTEPIDPRSLFRGDFVRLNYAISTLYMEELEGDNDFERRDRVYVVLAPGEKYWEPISIHHTLPALNPPQVAMKGRVEWTMSGRVDPGTQTFLPGTGLFVRYGIENYFVPEGEGRDLEWRPEGQVVDIRVAVDRRGNSGIKAVLVNGEERYTETLF